MYLGCEVFRYRGTLLLLGIFRVAAKIGGDPAITLRASGLGPSGQECLFILFFNLSSDLHHGGAHGIQERIEEAGTFLYPTKTGHSETLYMMPRR